MRNVTSKQESRSGASSNVGRNSADDLYTLGNVRIDDRATANPVDGHTINQVGMPRLLPSTNSDGEKAESGGHDSGETHPPDLSADSESTVTWEQRDSLAAQAVQKQSRQRLNRSLGPER